MKHVCGECVRESFDHPEQCWFGMPDVIRHPPTERFPNGVIEHSPHHDHYPPLCCPGCPCRSFETAHPESIGLPVAERISDKRLLRILSYQNVLTMEELVEERYALGAWRNVGLKRNLVLWRAIRDFEKERTHGQEVL